MLRLYPLVVLTYRTVLALLSPFNAKARDALRGRKAWLEKLKSDVKGKRDLIWIHCASIGEFEDVRVLIDLIARNNAGEVYLTFQSPTGVRKIKAYPGVTAVSYLPFDTAKNRNHFLDALQPSRAIFSRYELWLGYLQGLKQRGIATYLTGFRVTSANKYFHPVFGKYYLQCFSSFHKVFCEDQHSLQLLHQHFPNVSAEVAGNPRMDRVFQIGQGPRPDLDALFSSKKHKAVVLGSLEPSDFQMCAAMVRRLGNNIHWLITPHEVDEATLAEVERLFDRPIHRLSSISSAEDLPEYVLIDSVGILAQLYRYADAAIVGGGFDRKGVHNVLEPVVHGVPCAIGPNHRNYSDVLQLLDAGLLEVYDSADGLTSWVQSKLESPVTEERARLKAYVSDRLGASQKTFDRIFSSP